MKLLWLAKALSKRRVKEIKTFSVVFSFGTRMTLSLFRFFFWEVALKI